MFKKIAFLGKSAIIGAFLLESAQCNPTYAHRDYNVYPAYRGDIAVHNIEAILDDICTGSGLSWRNFHVDEKGFSCRQSVCVGGYQIQSRTNPMTGIQEQTTTCTEREDKNVTTFWASFKPTNFKICGRGPGLMSHYKSCDLIANDERQAFELSEALSIYKQEQK